MSTKKDFEQEMTSSDEVLVPKDSESKGTSRRKFTRNALVGGAVLLTLSNRSAWGATITTCISTNLLVSYANGQASALNNSDQQLEINNYYNNYNGEKEYINGDNTCYDRKGPSEPSDKKSVRTDAPWFVISE